LTDAAPGGSRRRRPRLAAAASAQFPDLFDDWWLVRDALAAAGIDATTAVWNDPAVDWTAFDLVLVSGAWDNIHHVDAFLAWVDGLAASGVPVRNSPATVHWNIDKHYLLDLERAGVPVVPTQWVEPDHDDGDDGDDGAGASHITTPLALPDGEIVVKPSVSGGGYSTARYEPHDHPAARAHVQQLLTAGRTAMVQPYEPLVDSEGETALIYTAGRFSHAVHKDPMIRRGVGPADNLIANQVVTGTTATPAQLVAAGQALAAAEQLFGPTMYARVDMVETLDRGPVLLELELLDPVLFFTEHPEGAVTFARQLAEQLVPL
jgi:glutathione synthase/RimK-type ligase-like ATP-grasp enzyme